MDKSVESNVSSLSTGNTAGSSSGPLLPEESASTRVLTRTLSTSSPVRYTVYKRRFFGLFQLVLLNIVVSWDWIALAPISDIAASYFETTETVINWLSTAFLFSFVVASPFTFWTLSRHGPKTSIIISSCLLLAGNWVKFAGGWTKNIGATMLGQLLIGLGQPFVLAAPTTYSDLWFTPSGRTTATALASLANPFGAALGQLITPFWVSIPADVPWSILWVSIIATAVCVPSLFVPKKPPSPPAPTLETAVDGRNDLVRPILEELRQLFQSVEFWLIFLPFSVYVGFFNAFSSLLNQILEPYGFTQNDAGIAGAILILVGLVAAAVVSPFNDRFKFYLWLIRIAIPLIATMYLLLIWAPPTTSIAFIYIVCGVLGAASFALVPVVLEFLVEILYPSNPSISSSLCWSGGQLLGGIFIVIMNALKDGQDANPSQNMHRALIFQAVLAFGVMPLPLCLGLFGRHGMVRLRRWESERHGADREDRDATIEPEHEARESASAEL